MKKYDVEIKEVLLKIIEVEADNKDDAIKKVEQLYKKTRDYFGL